MRLSLRLTHCQIWSSVLKIQILIFCWLSNTSPYVGDKMLDTPLNLTIYSILLLHLLKKRSTLSNIEIQAEFVSFFNCYCVIFISFIFIILIFNIIRFRNFPTLVYLEQDVTTCIGWYALIFSSQIDRY